MLDSVEDPRRADGIEACTPIRHRVLPYDDLRRDTFGSGDHLDDFQRPTSWVVLVHGQERTTVESLAGGCVLDVDVVIQEFRRAAPIAGLHPLEERPHHLAWFHAVKLPLDIKPSSRASLSGDFAESLGGVAIRNPGAMVPLVSDAPCSIARTLEVIGDRWTILILRSVFRGVRRFDAIQTDCGVARNILSDRLRNLVDHGVLTRSPYGDRPVRYEYRLTPKGVDLSPALVALMRWGDEWCNDTGGAPPVELVHETCGELLDQVFVCWRCNETVTPLDIRSKAQLSAAS